MDINELAKAMLGDTTKISERVKETVDQIDILKEIASDDKKYSEDTRREAAELQKVIEEILKAVSDKRKKDGKPTRNKDKKSELKSLDQSLLAASKSFRTSLEKIKNIDKSLNDVTRNINSSAIKSLRTSVSGRPMSGGGGGGGKPPKSVDYSFDPREFEDASNMMVANIFGAISSAVLGGMIDITQIFNGRNADMEFFKQMKVIGYQTQGINEDTKEMQKNFLDVGNSVKKTGYGVTIFQQSLLQNIKKGVKESVEITKTGLNLGKMLGMNETEAQQVSATFGQWSQNLNLNANQLSDIARGVKEVSRYTGITGTNLQEVVQSSEQFLTRMRAAGNLTSSATKNIITMQAEAKKLGVSEQVGELTRGLSNSSDLLLKTSAQSQALIFTAASSAGRLQDVMQGTLLNTKQGIKDFASGLEEKFKQISGGIDLKDLDSLNPASKAQLNLVIESTFGMGIEEYRKQVESLTNAGKTYANRLSDIDMQLGQNITDEERLALNRQKSEMALATAFDFSSKLADAGKATSSIDEAINKLKTTAGVGFKDSLNDLAILTKDISPELAEKVKGGDNAAIAQASALSSAKALKEGGGKDYSTKLIKTIKENDIKGFRTLQKQMSDDVQELNVKTITGTNPGDELTFEMHKLNEYFRSVMSPLLHTMASLVGGQGLLIASMSAKTGQGIFSSDIASGIMGMFGGKKAAPAAPIAGAAPIVGTEAAEAAAAAAGTEAAAAAAGTEAAAAAAGTEAAAAAAGAEAAVVTETSAFSAAMTSAGAALWTFIETVVLPLEIVLGVIGALYGNIQAGAEAANYFGVEQEKLTMSQYYAAKGAGTLTGALNFMTFGIFNTLLGTTGSVTKALAEMNAKIPLLSIIAAMLDSLAGVVWGTLRSISHIVMGVFEGIYLVVEPFGELISSIFDVVAAILSPLTGFNATLAETGTIFEITSDIVAGFGLAIRWLLKIVGGTIGLFYKIFTKPLSMLLRAGAYLIETVLHPFVEMFDALATWGMGVIKVIQGICKFDLKTIGIGYKMIFEGIIQGIGSLVSLIYTLPEIILNVLGDLLVSIGSIFDGIDGPIGSLLQLIMSPIKNIGALIMSLGDTLAGVSEIIMGIFTFDWNRIVDGFELAMYSIPMMLYDIFVESILNIKDILIDLPRWIIGAVLTGIEILIVEIPKMIYQAIASIGSIFDGIGGTLGAILQYIIAPIKIIGNLGVALSNTIGGVYDLLMGILNFNLQGILNGIYKVFTSIPIMLFNMFADLFRQIKAIFIEFPRWLLATMASVAESIIALPQTIVNGISSMIKNVSSMMSNMSTYIYDGFTNALSSVFDWISSWWGGGKKKSGGEKTPTMTQNISAVLVETLDHLKTILLDLPFAIVNGMLTATKMLIIEIPKMFWNMILSIGSMFDSFTGYFGTLLQTLTLPFKLVSMIATGMLDGLGGIFDILTGIFSFDGTKIINGLYNLLTSVPLMIYNVLATSLGQLGEMIGAVFFDLPVMIFNFWKDVFLDFPMWLVQNLLGCCKFLFTELPMMIMNGFMDGLSWLASNDWVGAIFAPYLEMLSPLSDAMNELYTAGGELYDTFISMFEPFSDLTSIFVGTSDAAASTWTWMGVLKSIIQGISLCIGALISTALIPLKWIIGIITIGVKLFAWFIGGVNSALQDSMSVMGEFSTFVLGIFSGMFNGILSCIPNFIKRWLGISSPAKETKSESEPVKQIETALVAQTKETKSEAEPVKQIETALVAQTKETIDATKKVEKPEASLEKTIKSENKSLASLSRKDRREAITGNGKLMSEALSITSKEQNKLKEEFVKSAADKNGAGKSVEALLKSSEEKALKEANEKNRSDSNNVTKITDLDKEEMKLYKYEPKNNGTYNNGNDLAEKASTLLNSKKEIGMFNEGPVVKGGLENAKLFNEEKQSIPMALRNAIEKPPEPSPNPQPLAIADVHQKMQQEHAANDLGGNKSNLPDFATMIAVNEEQLSYLVKIYEELKNNKSNPSGMSEEQKKSNTASNIKTTQSANTRNWNTGKHHQGPSRQTVKGG